MAHGDYHVAAFDRWAPVKAQRIAEVVGQGDAFLQRYRLDLLVGQEHVQGVHIAETDALRSDVDCVDLRLLFQ